MVTKDDIQQIWVDEEGLFVLTIDGRQASYRFADWPRLATATPQQRETFTLSFDGIHWPELDEDLSLDGMFKQIS